MSKTPTATAKSSELAIFARLLRNGKGQMSAELARYVLSLGFDAEDQGRMTELAVRNQDGTLSSQEREELFNYVKAGHLLALLQSQAKSLKERKTCSRRL